ncbi:nitroreductase family protein [Thermodesulfobacterium sp. TA1]|uniref:nitroreductase family protein n=1 Tax=Thermodesulfobacterium sp. TA1 TaxID=2234087 RepID=UPI001231D1EC|nr:nitroreductase [Thermodesulfobacterium sp. TA1]QER41446.1 nitroreductase family protein [Thermodesulfobacterium sp. TA1]
MGKESLKKAVFEAILSRRSIRRYLEEKPDKQLVYRLLEAGIWAPSGLNNQPWRFVIVWSDEIKQKLAELTRYQEIVKRAPVLIGVFLDREKMYHQIKDHQSAGACIQNILLAAHASGLGACWLGEILKNEEKVKEVLSLPKDKYELSAFIALGYPNDQSQRTSRHPLESFILKEL